MSSNLPRMMWLYAILYGAVSLLSLWGFGGGEEFLFWSRTPWVAGLTLIAAWAVVLFTKEKERLLQLNPAIKTLGIGGALLVGIPLCLILFFAHQHPAIAPLLMKVPGLWSVLLFTLLVAPAFELVYRGILQPHWGIFGCAFLEALNVGFGTHKVLPFLCVLILGYLGGMLRHRFGFLTGLAFRCVWTALLLTTLSLV